MNDSCPILTPAEKQYVDIQDKAERAMMDAIRSAVEHAAGQAAEELRLAGSQERPPARDYFAAVAHQKLFLLLCGADAETFAGGNPEIAAHLIANSRKISEHYWKKGEQKQIPDEN